MFGELTVLLAALFVWAAVRVARALYERRDLVFDRHFTMDDRRLVGAAAFTWLVPMVVLCGALSALAMLHLLGSRAGTFAYAAYWCQVAPPAESQLSHALQAAVAATPAAVALATALGMMVWTRRRPHSAAVNFLRLELARILIALTLVLQPALSLIVKDGWFHALRSELNLTRPHLGDLVALLFGVVALLALWAWRSGHWRRRYQWLATPLYDQARDARRRIALDTNDTEARAQLARSFLGAGQTVRALAELDDALAVDPGHPLAGYLAGIAALQLGDPRRAARYLLRAGQRLEAEGRGEGDELHYELVLALGAARLALGDTEGALMTMERAAEVSPREPRATLLHAEALAAAGQPERAAAKLRHALVWASEPLAREIRRRLSLLG